MHLSKGRTFTARSLLVFAAANGLESFPVAENHDALGLCKGGPGSFRPGDADSENPLTNRRQGGEWESGSKRHRREGLRDGQPVKTPGGRGNPENIQEQEVCSVFCAILSLLICTQMSRLSGDS